MDAFLVLMAGVLLWAFGAGATTIRAYKRDTMRKIGD